MGTMRWQKERADGEERARLEAESKTKREAVHNELTELEAQVGTLQRTVAEKRLMLLHVGSGDVAEGARRTQAFRHDPLAPSEGKRLDRRDTLETGTGGFRKPFLRRECARTWGRKARPERS